MRKEQSRIRREAHKALSPIYHDLGLVT